MITDELIKICLNFNIIILKMDKKTCFLLQKNIDNVVDGLENISKMIENEEKI